MVNDAEENADIDAEASPVERNARTTLCSLLTATLNQQPS
jgi:hypothetical protein